MISEIFPRMLRATKTERVVGGEEQEIQIHEEKVSLSELVPEELRMTLSETVSLNVAIRALKRVCFRHDRAKLKIMNIRESGLDGPSRAILRIIRCRQARHKAPVRFKVVLLVNGDFVSFVPL